MYEIILYENVHGISPIHHFISELDQKSKRSKDAKIQLKQIMFQLDLLAELGTRCQSEYVKYIRNNIWELRPGDNRILFFSWENNKIVLLHSFRKKTNKTPIGEIKQAEHEIADWINRHGG